MRLFGSPIDNVIASNNANRTENEYQQVTVASGRSAERLTAAAKKVMDDVLANNADKFQTKQDAELADIKAKAQAAESYSEDESRSSGGFGGRSASKVGAMTEFITFSKRGSKI